MIDCSSTEIAAIKEVLPSVSILLCHWHVKRTWETNIKKEIKIANATHQTTSLQEQDGTFHTNNLIETYHNKLKTYYLGRSRNFRVDHLLYMRSQIVVLDYRQEALKVQLGFQNITLNAGEKRRKLLADAVDIQTGSLMVSSVKQSTGSTVNEDYVAISDVEEGLQIVKQAIALFDKIGKPSQTRPSRQS
ncbi:hypothetical protein HPULCUR_003843 [Helicostylum pulchrum]|uniref:MULE transposase domain-containing protein n=1 Tax=Helicostylum pulchrum TaxID=562976 RepID=A0ABP9XVU6_9FUNG